MKLLNGKDDPTFEIVSIMGSDGYKAIQLIEKMGRISYQSQDKINKDSAIRFVNMLRDRGHESVLEHSCMSVIFTNCSRGLTHELVRHRLMAITQESTRYVDESHFDVVIPPQATGDEEIILKLGGEEKGYMRDESITLRKWFELNADVYEQLQKYYKWAKQDARQVLPIGITSEIGITCNFREWRHIFNLRTAKPAHWEIKSVMGKLLLEVKRRVPVVFDDFCAIDLDSYGIQNFSATLRLKEEK